jgi:hypothetical protein
MDLLLFSKSSTALGVALIKFKAKAYLKLNPLKTLIYRAIEVQLKPHKFLNKLGMLY